MTIESTLHEAGTLDVELSALHGRTEAMRLQATRVLAVAHDALSQAIETQRRSSRARARAASRRQRRHARLADQLRLHRPNVIAFESQAERHRATASTGTDTRIGLDRAA